MTRRTLLTGAVLGMGIIGLQQMATGLMIFVKAELAQFLLERAWAKSLHGEVAVRPWPWADTWPIAKLTVPAHDVSVIVLAGANGRNLAFGPGYLLGGAKPGAAGTAVLTGHRDTHFKFLANLEVGDRLVLHAPQLGPFPYRVREIQIVDSRDARIGQDMDSAVLALVTCYPFDALVPGGPLRYVVIAEAEFRETAQGEAVYRDEE